MAQIFSARTDRRLRRLLLALPVLFIVLLALGFYQFRSSAHWGVGGTADQPIGFRHDIHVSELGLDCGFCHTGAEHESTERRMVGKEWVRTFRSRWVQYPETKKKKHTK